MTYFKSIIINFTFEPLQSLTQPDVYKIPNLSFIEMEHPKSPRIISKIERHKDKLNPVIVDRTKQDMIPV